MPTHIAAHENSSYRQGIESLIRGEYAVSTIWLISYVLALGVAITSLLVSEIFELAAQY